MEKIEIPEQLEKELKEYRDNLKSVNSEDYVLSEEKANEILKAVGFNENDNVEFNDFFQFSRYFGLNKEWYLALKPLKDKAEVNWEDMKELKWGDIDLDKETIKFHNQKIKPLQR